MGVTDNAAEYLWFKTFLWLEAYVQGSFSMVYSDHANSAISLFQMPVFIFGARGLWRGEFYPDLWITATN